MFVQQLSLWQIKYMLPNPTGVFWSKLLGVSGRRARLGEGLFGPNHFLIPLQLKASLLIKHMLVNTLTYRKFISCYTRTERFKIQHSNYSQIKISTTTTGHEWLLLCFQTLKQCTLSCTRHRLENTSCIQTLFSTDIRFLTSIGQYI